MASRRTLPPYEKDPRRWPRLRWYDRHTNQPLRTAPAGLADGPERLSDAIRDGLIPLRTIGQVLARYSNRPEHKSLQPDCAPAGENTAGQQRRPIRSGPPITALIGKEGNRLLERATGEMADPTDYRTTYTPGTQRWRSLVLPALRTSATPSAPANWRRPAPNRVIKQLKPVGCGYRN